MAERSRVHLPDHVPPRFDVYLNGVPQQRERDYRIEGRWLVFDRDLQRERLGKWRWFWILMGVVGHYGRNDSVDVIYEAQGRRHVATGLPIERPETP